MIKSQRIIILQINQSILSSVSEYNIPRDISNFDFPTRIEAESYNSKESDSAFDDKNELNLEHNWRNKNTSQTNKRKTYLDNCSDWDIMNAEKIRTGITNL